MAHLIIKIMAKVQLSKGSALAVAETLKAHATLGCAVAAFQADMIHPEWLVEQHYDEVEPAPAPKRPRKPRAALGSSPLADAKGGSPHPSYTPPPARPPITGADGLSPEAGADPGPLSELAAAALRQAGRS